MVAVPAATPVTTPVAEPISAVPASELLHEPPGNDELSVVDCDGHISIEPLIVPPVALTVTVVVSSQPVVVVYVMSAVPELIPPSTPVTVLIVPTAGFEDIQVPLPGAADNVPVPPVHSDVVPDITGLALTVITLVLWQNPGTV